jgi:IS605 OrfB family transposase
MIKTTVIKIKNDKIKKSLTNFIYKYRHFENIFIILLKNYREDFEFLSDYSIMRAVIGDTTGGKVAEEVKYIKMRYKDNQLLKDLIEVSKELKLHNLSMIIRRVKGDYKKFFTNLKKGIKVNTVSAKKLSLMTNYSIPLDTNSWSLKKKNQIGLNLNDKMFYIHSYHNRLINIIANFKNIKSVLVKYQNNEIYLNISYEQEPLKIIEHKNSKSAGIDIGINNLLTIFTDDKTTKSLMVDGSRFKQYNSSFNRFNAKLNNSISQNVTKWFTKDKEKDIKYPAEYNSRGIYLKKFKTFLIEKRNLFFKNEWHKLSKRVTEFFNINKVTNLYISRNLTFAKNQGDIKLGKKTKQNFIQIPFGKLLDFIQYKAEELGIKVINIDEAYTSKTSCINADVFAVQEKAKNKEPILTKKIKDYSKALLSPVKRGLLKDKISNIVFNADVNGAVNHIKVATKQCFKWLNNYMFKIANPIKIKSDYEFNIFLLNSVSDKSILSKLRKERCNL